MLTLIYLYLKMYLYLKQSLMKLFQQHSFFFQGVFCNPYRSDCNRNGDGIMLYIREDIPVQVIDKKFRNNHGYFFFEFNLRKWKSGFFVAHIILIRILYLRILIFWRKELDLHPSNYENFILLRNLIQKWQTRI